MNASQALPGGGPIPLKTHIIPPPPPGLNYIAAIQPSLIFIIVQIGLASMLVPLLIALLSLATKELWRKPIFYFNIVSILSGILIASLSCYINVKSMLHPLEPQNVHLFLVAAIFSESVPVFIECILLFRLVAVYPPSRTPICTLFVVYVPPVLLKIARIVNITVAMREMAHTYLIMPSVLAATEEAWQAPGTRVEFFLQVFDNAYMSILFLYKIREARKRTKRISAVGFHRSSYGSKLRTLFWIAASNFVFPVMLSLAQIIFLYVASDNFNAVYVALLFFVNDIVEIVCALLATLLVVGNRVQESIDAEKKIVIDLSSTTVGGLRRSFLPTGGPSEVVEFESHNGYPMECETRFLHIDVLDAGTRSASRSRTPSFIQYPESV